MFHPLWSVLTRRNISILRLRRPSVEVVLVVLGGRRLELRRRRMREMTEVRRKRSRFGIEHADLICNATATEALQGKNGLMSS